MEEHPLTYNELGYLLLGAAIARTWNVVKRLYLYRSELFHSFSRPTLARKLAQFRWWLVYGFMWWDSYLGEPEEGSLTKVL